MKNSKKDSLLFIEQAHFGQESLQISALNKLSSLALKIPQVWQDVNVYQISAGLFGLCHSQVS